MRKLWYLVGVAAAITAVVAAYREGELQGTVRTTSRWIAAYRSPHR